MFDVRRSRRFTVPTKWNLMQNFIQGVMSENAGAGLKPEH